MKRKILSLMVAACSPFMFVNESDACTGISLSAKDGSYIYARTIEWGGSELNSQYVIVPRGYEHQAFTIKGQGMTFKSKYGYVGLSVEQKEFVAEGINEVGLSAGLFYFPNYGEYEAFDEAKRSSSISDLQLVSWILANCSTIEEVKEKIKDIHVVAIDPRASTVHWRIAEPTGKQVVLEIVDGKLNFYDNKVGVITNSPGFEWHVANLNNYVNLYPGSAQSQNIGEEKISQFGAGSGFLGMPGDVTPPSRFVRAAFYKASAPQKQTAYETVEQSFQILNNFDIPIGIEFLSSQTPTDIPSATQWTSVTDTKNRKIYFRTMYNSTIRCIDLNKIDFNSVGYKFVPMDKDKKQPVEEICVTNI